MDAPLNQYRCQHAQHGGPHQSRKRGDPENYHHQHQQRRQQQQRMDDKRLPQGAEGGLYLGSVRRSPP